MDSLVKARLRELIKPKKKGRRATGEEGKNGGQWTISTRQNRNQKGLKGGVLHGVRLGPTLPKKDEPERVEGKMPYLQNE